MSDELMSITLIHQQHQLVELTQRAEKAEAAVLVLRDLYLKDNNCVCNICTHCATKGHEALTFTDEGAATRIDNVVKEIVNGILSPDTDFVSQWVERFGDSNMKSHSWGLDNGPH